MSDSDDRCAHTSKFFVHVSSFLSTSSPFTFLLIWTKNEAAKWKNYRYMTNDFWELLKARVG